MKRSPISMKFRSKNDIHPDIISPHLFTGFALFSVTLAQISTTPFSIMKPLQTSEMTNQAYLPPFSGAAKDAWGHVPAYVSGSRDYEI
jgi:hypothetical protein